MLVKYLKDKGKGSLYHKTQVALAYNSNRIEGSRLTEEQDTYRVWINYFNLNTP